MKGTHWIKTDVRIVECFRAWGEPWQARHPWFEIVADIEAGAGRVQRVSARQRLNTHTHHWRPPDPGDSVSARWDPVRGRLQLDLHGDPRYDEKVIRWLGRTREAPTGNPTGVGNADLDHDRLRLP